MLKLLPSLPSSLKGGKEKQKKNEKNCVTEVDCVRAHQAKPDGAGMGSATMPPPSPPPSTGGGRGGFLILGGRSFKKKKNEPKV
jgi:hypothetical protein